MSQDVAGTSPNDPEKSIDDPQAVEALSALSDLIYEARVAARDNPEDDPERIDINVSRKLSMGRYESAAKLCYATLMGSENFNTPHGDYDTVSRYFEGIEVPTGEESKSRIPPRSL